MCVERGIATSSVSSTVASKLSTWYQLPVMAMNRARVLISNCTLWASSVNSDDGLSFRAKGGVSLSKLSLRENKITEKTGLRSRLECQGDSTS